MSVYLFSHGHNTIDLFTFLPEEENTTRLRTFFLNHTSLHTHCLFKKTVKFNIMYIIC